jgi:hypothetical protein
MAQETTPTSPSGKSPPATGSGRSRRAGSASPFIGDPGPAFDARQADELAGEPASPRGQLHALPGGGELGLQVEEETVRGFLTAQGELAHLAIGVGELDWRYTEADLRAIAPPLTRIVNRYPAAAETVAALGDPAAAGIGLFNYGLRSLQERRAVLAAREAEPDVPITGAHAPAGTGPTQPAATGPGPEAAGGGPPPEGIEWHTQT